MDAHPRPPRLPVPTQVWTQSLSVPKRLALPPQPPYQKRSQAPVSRRWYQRSEKSAQAVPGSLSRAHSPGTATALRPFPGLGDAVGSSTGGTEGVSGVLGGEIGASPPGTCWGERAVGEEAQPPRGVAPVLLTHCAGVPGGGSVVLAPGGDGTWGHPGVLGCWLLSAAMQKR